MPKHQFAIFDVTVCKLNAKKDAYRLLHDVTGQQDDLLDLFDEFLEDHIGNGRPCKKQRYIRKVSLERKGRCIWFDVEVGRWGSQGRVIDTNSNNEAYAIRSQDAPAYLIRGFLVVPDSGEHGVLAAEVVGGQSFMSTLWPEFKDWFGPRLQGQSLWPRAEAAVETPAWQKYLDDAMLRSVTFTSYERSSDQARRVRATDWSVRAYRGQMLPTDWIGKLVKQRLNPKSVVTDFPSGFVPEETRLEMTGPDGPKTIVIEKDWPRFLHELSEDDDPRPDDDEFRPAVVSEMGDTLDAMGLDADQVLAGAV